MMTIANLMLSRLWIQARLSIYTQFELGMNKVVTLVIRLVLLDALDAFHVLLGGHQARAQARPSRRHQVRQALTFHG